MKRDIKILKQQSGTVQFQVYGAEADTGLMLLQRLYVILLSPGQTGYRNGETQYTLLKFLQGGNMPQDQVMNSILAICCANTLHSLDDDDKALIDSFTGVCTDGLITCTLTLKDGTTLEGSIDV